MSDQEPAEVDDEQPVLAPEPVDPDALRRAERRLAERIPTRMVPDLDRITALVDVLGAPHRAYPAVHITGTNGKTSTTRMVDALLRAFGLRTGGYTSPHLRSVTERITVDGEPLSDQRFADVLREIEPFLALVDSRHPDRVTYFETLTAMAFAAFADTPVDVAVVEVGMGGEWDATNVLHASTCVITPIALDHPELGSTIAEVAREKAGIIHEGAFVVSGMQPLDAAEVLVRRCAEMGADLVAEGVHVAVLDRRVAVGGMQLTLRGLGGTYDDVFVPLHGGHQASNALCALVAVESFLGATSQPLDVEAVRVGLATVTSPGRLEVVRRSPTVLLDGAHNPAGAAALATALEESFTFDGLIGVLAVLADKDVLTMLEVLEPVLDSVVVTTNASPRALSADDLAQAARRVFGDDRVEVADSLPDAIDLAVERADAIGSAGGVLVTGSLYTVGEARTLLARP